MSEIEITAKFIKEPTKFSTQWGGTDDPLVCGLVIDETYKVEEIEVRSSHTKLHLEKFPGKVFQSTLFEIKPDNAWEDAAREYRRIRGYKF